MQTYIMPKVSKNNLVAQSNKLVEARYSLTLYEQRLVIIMMSMVEPSDEDFKDYIIKVTDFIEILNLKGGNVYGNIKSILRGMRAKELLIENGKDYLITGWVSSAEYRHSKGEILLSFDKKLKPYLLALKSNFTTQRLNTIIQFKSIYTIRIYSFLRQYNVIGERTFDIVELKEMLGLKENQYPIYAEFKRRVIIPVHNELNLKNKDESYISDIGFNFEQIKTGRKVTGIKFIIIKHPQDKRVKQIGLNNNEALNYLLDYGIEKNKSEELATACTQNEIERCIMIFEKKKKEGTVKAGAGLLIHLIESGAGKKTQKEIEEEESKKNELSEKEKEGIEIRKIKLSKEFQNEKIANFIASLSEGEIKDYTEKLLKAYKGKVFETELIKNTGITNSLTKIELIKHIPNYEEEKEAYIKENL